MKLNLTLAAAALMALPLLGQTAAEQLQKGIFAQESQGKIDDAIAIYRQLANSTLTPREVAAQAQYRLSQSLLQKGDIATATREMERLERDFSEYKNLISSLATHSQVHAPAAPPPPEVQYDLNSRITVQGKVKQMIWMNPLSWLTVDANGEEYRIQLAAPNALIRLGLTKDTLKIGDQVLVEGSGALDGSRTLLGKLVSSPEGQLLFERSKLPPLAAQQNKEK